MLAAKSIHEVKPNMAIKSGVAFHQRKSQSLLPLATRDSESSLCKKISHRQTRRPSVVRSSRGKVSRSPSPTDKSSYRYFVDHTYHDHSHDPEVADVPTQSLEEQETNKKGESHHHCAARGGPRGGVSTPFPEKLHEMLSKAECEMFDHIISWQPHGRSFAVHQPKRFVAEVMPRFFKQSKLTSFQRQLNLYGFSRLTAGADRGGYYHELFLRGRLYLCKRMIRTRVKGTGVKAAASPSTEPNFYDMEPCLEADSIISHESQVVFPTCGLTPIQSEASLSSDASMDDVVVDTLPAIIPDDACSSANHHWTLESAKNCSDINLLILMNEVPDRVVSAPSSPQAVMSELEASVADIAKFRESQCASPLPSFMEDGDDEEDLENVLQFHSGDEVLFEGQRFHYLDTDFYSNDDDDDEEVTTPAGLQNMSDASCLDDYTTSLVEWQVDDALGELSIST